MVKGYTRHFKPLDILSSEEVEAIHRGALDVLVTTGIRMEHERALKLMADHGCRVDFETRRARIPPGLVEECLRRVPSSYRMRARDPDQDLMVGGNTLYFMQGMGMRYVDLDTWETRPATVREHREAMIVADALDNLHMADAVFAYTERTGIPPAMTMIENLASGLRHSTKAEHFGYQQDCEVFAIPIAQALSVDLEPEVDSAAPLTFYSGSVDATFRYVEAGMPLQPTSAFSAGAEGPATYAAALVLEIAQMMAFVVLVQLIKPGAPLSVQHGIKPLDMQRGTPRFGASGYALSAAATNQLLRKYRIPSCPACGFTSTSKEIDFQAGYERAMGALLSAITGANLQIFHGGSGSELLYHPVLAILDDDIAGWVGRFLQGITVTDETLAIDLINLVGPIPGHYLDKEHTRRMWKLEDFLPKAADREVYAVWVKGGKKDALALAKDRMREILATHKPAPLTSAQEQAVERILREAREYYRKRGLIPEEDWGRYMKALTSEDQGE
jgi:trimethylamine--corrinoid protein Co-methyltransferase